MAVNGGIAYIDQATTKVMVTNATGTLRRSVGGTFNSSERAAFSPDGRRIAVGPEIMNPDGSGAVRLPFPVHHPTWSPDGRRIAFIADIQASIGSPDRHRNYGTLMMAPVDNSAAPTRVTDRAFIGYPAWSPDGASIAYSRDRQGATATEIVRHQLASGRQDIIVGPQPGLPEITMATWSPDGRQLVFALINTVPDASGTLGQIITIDSDGTNQRVVASSRQHRLIFPCWSPDGLQIAYTEIHSFQDETHTYSTATLLAIPATGGTTRTIAPGTGPSWAVAREPEINVHGEPNPVEPGTPLTLSATAVAAGGGPLVIGQGTFTFAIDGRAAGTVPIPVAPPAPRAIAVLRTTAPGPGPHRVTATYSGDGEISPGSGTAALTVSKAKPTLTITATPRAAVLGAPVTLRVTVRSPSSPPSGSVQFFVGLTGVGHAALTGGTAQLTTTGLTDGLDQPVYATYDGDDDNEPAVSPIEQLDVLVPTTTTLTADPERSVFGQPVRLTVAVARTPGGPTGLAPTGTVDITDDATVIGSAPLTAGTAQVLVTPRVGTRGIRATYRAAGATAPSRSQLLAYTVNPAATTTTLTLTNPQKGPTPTIGRPTERPGSRPVTVRAGQPLRFDPTIVAVAPSTGAPAGTISYTDHLELSDRQLGTAVYDARRRKTATGRITATFDQPGKHRITASYQGNDSFTASQGTLTIDVIASNATQPDPVAPGGT
jgi:hypothetical protein